MENTKPNIPTHVGFAHLGADEQYIETIWLQQEGPNWMQHRDSNPTCWDCTTGLAVDGPRATIRRVSGVRETTDQDKARWLQKQLTIVQEARGELRSKRTRMAKQLAELDQDAVLLNCTAAHLETEAQLVAQLVDKELP